MGESSYPKVLSPRPVIEAGTLPIHLSPQPEGEIEINTAYDEAAGVGQGVREEGGGAVA